MHICDYILLKFAKSYTYFSHVSHIFVHVYKCTGVHKPHRNVLADMYLVLMLKIPMYEWRIKHARALVKVHKCALNPCSVGTGKCLHGIL